MTTSIRSEAQIIMEWTNGQTEQSRCLFVRHNKEKKEKDYAKNGDNHKPIKNKINVY